MKVAIMQPAFMPPASYFRLFAASDLFVIYNDVQFNRRWYTHRQKVSTRNGEKKWFTLPFKKSDRDTTRICDLEWQEGKERDVSPEDFVISVIGIICCALRIPFNKVIKSYSLNIDPSIKGQDRIIAICKKLGATEYINSPGGRSLYDEEAFGYHGIKLTFLPDYNGSYENIIERILKENPEDIRKEIYANL